MFWIHKLQVALDMFGIVVCVMEACVSEGVMRYLGKSADNNSIDVSALRQFLNGVSEAFLRKSFAVKICDKFEM